MSRPEIPRGLGGLLLRPGLWRLCAETAAALVRARLRLRHVRAAEFARSDLPAQTGPSETLSGDARRIAWAVPRVAKAMPFRADCLVQAMAAQAMLARRGLDSEVHIGARKILGGFAAHAWLTHRGEVVTGGEIAGYSRVLGPGG